MNFNGIYEWIMDECNSKHGYNLPYISSFKFLKNIIVIRQSDIIEESIDAFPSKAFRRLFARMNDFNFNVLKIKTSELLNLIDIEFDNDIKIKIDETFFLKFDFANFKSFCHALNEMCMLDEETIKNDVDVIETFNIISKDDSVGCYCTLQDDHGKFFNVIFLYDEHFDENVIKHEMIHFFQKNVNEGFVKNSKFTKINDVENTYGLSVQKDELKLIFNRNEMIPYINSICYVLEKNVDNASQALNFVKKLQSIFKNVKKDPNAFIKESKKLNEYKWFLNNKKLFDIILLSIIHKRNMTLFYYVISNYFKE